MIDNSKAHPRIIIPETVLYSTLKMIILTLQQETTLPENQRTLFHLLKDAEPIGRLNYYEQAKNIFGRDGGTQRQVGLTVGYNLERGGMPTVHILLPGEQSQPNIGQGEGYTEDYQVEENVSYKESFSLAFETTYTLLLTSDNADEVVIMHHVLRSLLYTLAFHFNDKGLYNIKYASADLMITTDMLPQTIFHRNINMSFQYDTEVPSLWIKHYCNFNNLKFEGEVIDY